MGAYIKKVILICSSCGKETESGNSSKNLHKRIRAALNNRRDNVLVLLSSCLDICPEEGTTIGYSSANGITLEVIADDLNEESIIQKI